jgi:hypothetical protein
MRAFLLQNPLLPRIGRAIAEKILTMPPIAIYNVAKYGISIKIAFGYQEVIK